MRVLGQNGERGDAILTPNELVFTFEGSYQWRIQDCAKGVVIGKDIETSYGVERLDIPPERKTNF